ncbi:hypothetical protein QQ045_004392 [Rhodiola kirilowii]
MGRSKGRNNGGLFPNSLKIISSCIRTVSTNASTVASTVRSAGASVAASIAAAADDHKDQVVYCLYFLFVYFNEFGFVVLFGVDFDACVAGWLYIVDCFVAG